MGSTASRAVARLTTRSFGNSARPAGSPPATSQAILEAGGLEQRLVNSPR
jgi:hypothetical protein